MNSTAHRFTATTSSFTVVIDGMASDLGTYANGAYHLAISKLNTEIADFSVCHFVRNPRARPLLSMRIEVYLVSSQ